jgi:hypothetical protein
MEMAHSLLDFILHDNNIKPLNIKPQQIVLGSLKNPVLRALFAAHVNPDMFICEDPEGSRFDLYRLASEAKPEQLNYAASTVQSWFPDVNFNVARDSTYMTCDLPENVLIKRLMTRLQELDSQSKKLKSKSGILLDNCTFNGFNSIALINKFLGPVIKEYNIPYVDHDNAVEVC